jgi:hypothetical protein
MLPLAAQKPSQFWRKCFACVHKGQENNTCFSTGCSSLNRLSRELRVLLYEVDMADKQALGVRIDPFAAHNSRLAYEVVAAAYSLLRVYAQTTFYQENLAFCFQLCTVTHLVGFSAAPLVFLFLCLLPLQLNQIWRIFCVMYLWRRRCFDFI